MRHWALSVVVAAGGVMARRPIDPQELAREKRDMARRARRLAVTQGPADRARLTQYADELDKEAADLERQASQPTPEISPPVVVHQQQQLEGMPHTEEKTPLVPPPPVVVHEQQQLQQQEETQLPTEPGKRED